MLKINNEQMEVFKFQSKSLFVKKSILFLKDNAIVFTNGRTDIELEYFIFKVIHFSESNNIKKGRSVQKIMLLKIEHDFSYVLSENLKRVLFGSKFSENYRINKFEESISLMSGRSTITLDTEL